MILVITFLLLVFLLAVGLYVIFAESVINSIVAMSIFSINVAVLFVLLQAPDVAMAQAVIGAGILTAFFVVAVNKTEGF